MTSETVALWLNPDTGAHCLLDREDYEWAIKWRWHTVPNRQGTAHYPSRMTRAKGKNVRIYLHKEVLKRSGAKPRTKAHTIGDHIDGDTLNIRRANLRWATAAGNRHNDKRGRARRAGV